MLLLKDLLNYLEALLNTSSFNDFCPNGLQIEGKEILSTIGFAVSADLKTIERAFLEGCDALVVHHGLFWNHDPYPLIGTKKRKVEKLIKAEISLLAYHLPLDAHIRVGNNWKAATDLGWSELKPFGKHGKDQWIGVRGHIKPTSIDFLIDQLTHYYGSKPNATVLKGKPEIREIALISGGSYRSIKDAALEGIDCFISGNFDEPAWSMAEEEGIHYIAMGHTITEKIGPKALCQDVQKRFGIKSIFIDTDNPF